jgi:integrase
MNAGENWEDGERSYVFHNSIGKPYYNNTPSFVKRHNLKQIRLYDLRHSAASLLLEEGVDLKTIQERLGHKKYQTTVDIYAHISEKVKKESASKLDKFDPANKFSSTSRQQLNLRSSTD